MDAWAGGCVNLGLENTCIVTMCQNDRRLRVIVSPSLTHDASVVLVHAIVISLLGIEVGLIGRVSYFSSASAFIHLCVALVAMQCKSSKTSHPHKSHAMETADHLIHRRYTKTSPPDFSFRFGARPKSGKVKPRRQGGAIVAIGEHGGLHVAQE